MNGIYTVLFALYFLIFAVNTGGKFGGVLLDISFVILIASIPLQIWL